MEEKAAEWVDLYHEQANIFSGVVGILGVRALDSISPYKKHKHPDIAQQNFPDLSLGGQLDPPPETALNPRAAPGLGRSNRTTTTPVGTSCGGTWWTRRSQ